MSGSGAAAPVTLLRGDDEVVLRDAVRSLVDELVGDDDRSLVVEEVEVGASTEEDAHDPLLALVDAAQTPPFLTERRVVLGRLVDKRERNDQVAALVEYLADPLPTTLLVLEWRGRVPKALQEAVVAAKGAVVDTAPGRKVAEWVGQQLVEADLHVDPAGRQRLVTWVGDEPSRLLGLVDLLRSTYGTGTKVGVDDLEPFLGDDGGVPPWELTDAIDRGDRTLALELLHRMLGAGDRHPFQVLATIHAHVARILRLDGAAVQGEKDAAELLGMKGSTFPARKALAQSRKLGHERIVRMLDLVAEADLDLRGGKAWPDHLVLEVLVARLATMSR